MNKPQQFPYARQSAGHAPIRRMGSVRRTTSIDSEWLDGFGEPWVMTGRGRDLLTSEAGETSVLDEGEFRILASPIREILELEISPDHPQAQSMVGVRAGGASRMKLAELLGDIRGTPAYQLMDDFAGASLVAGWIWSQWRDDWMADRKASAKKFGVGRKGAMLDVCTGFAEGASSFGEDGLPDHLSQSRTEVGSLVNPDDESGWHEMPVQSGVMSRRARRIDVWREGGNLMVDAGFQDSGSNPEGGRTAVHEYRVYAQIDEKSGTLTSLDAQPLILPYRECPGAASKAQRMVGKNVSEFRDEVLSVLPGTLGCTHLNDVMRALADVPQLARLLPICNR